MCVCVCEVKAKQIDTSITWKSKIFISTHSVYRLIFLSTQSNTFSPKKKPQPNRAHKKTYFTETSGTLLFLFPVKFIFLVEY